MVYVAGKVGRSPGTVSSFQCLIATTRSVRSTLYLVMNRQSGGTKRGVFHACVVRVGDGDDDNDDGADSCSVV